MLPEARSGCPIALTLDVIGDRWTLIILRDMIGGKKRFSEFRDSPEKIASNILTDRLALMEEAGLVEKRKYSNHARRFEYHLTEMGKGLQPVMQQMCIWGNKHFPDSWVAPEHFFET